MNGSGGVDSVLFLEFSTWEGERNPSRAQEDLVHNEHRYLRSKTKLINRHKKISYLILRSLFGSFYVNIISRIIVTTKT